jgi:excinuclease UvrABC nuclease subunit
VEIERSPVIIEAPETPELVHSDILVAAGFRRLGEFKKLSEAEFGLDTHAPKDPGVYAFALDEVIVYVGLTQTGLKTRLDHYRRGHHRQKTSARVKKLILGELKEGKKIQVFIASPNGMEWNGLPVNTAAGLEIGLIQLIKPAWNIQNKKPLA